MDSASSGTAAVSESAHWETQNQAEEVPEVVLETGVPLAESMLWHLQRAFYDRRGATAWSDGTVPFYVTCNPFMARAYARVIVGFLRDCAGGFGAQIWSQERETPAYVVELGAGSGRFAFLLLRQLRSMLRALVPRWGDGSPPPLRYVMTDFTESNLRAWAEHPALQPFVAEGLLDFARFDAERDRELTLLHSGAVLAPGTMTGPVIAIANYLFDTLTHDAWRIEGGELRHGRTTLVARHAEAADIRDPALIERLGLRLEYVPTEPPFDGDPALHRILDGYRARLGDTSILLPVGALRCLRTLTELLDASGGHPSARLLLLSADKGFLREEELLDREEPSLAVHGSFSLMVNFHAIGAYTRDRGGLALDAPTWDGGLAVTAFLLDAATGASDETFRETSQAFKEAASDFGPFHFYALMKSLPETCPSPTLEQIVTMLRLSEWDPAIVMRYGRALMADASSASPRLRRELINALARVGANYFPIGETDDVPFQIGAILQSIPRPAEAIPWYERSLAQFGAHPATYTNIGLCLYVMARLEEALAAFDRALDCDPGHGPARDGRLRAQAELESRKTAVDALVTPAGVGS